MITLSVLVTRSCRSLGVGSTGGFFMCDIMRYKKIEGFKTSYLGKIKLNGRCGFVYNWYNIIKLTREGRKLGSRTGVGDLH